MPFFFLKQHIYKVGLSLIRMQLERKKKATDSEFCN